MTSSLASAAPTPPPSPLIFTDELLGRLPNVTVIDVRYRMGGPPGHEEYLAGHIPGAAYVDLDTDLASAPGDGGRHPLPDPEVFVAAMRRAGVYERRPVVVYDDWSGLAAARAWWLLRHYGHPDVRVLDGGWTAWLADGGATETGEPALLVSDFEPGPSRVRMVEAGGVLDVPVLVDARSGERYRGENETVDPVAGHIPGALSVPATSNLADDGRFRSVDNLREVYAEAGVPVDAADGDVAVYCGSGVTAAHDLIALELLGVNAALYPGSWSEWITDPERPVSGG